MTTIDLTNFMLPDGFSGHHQENSLHPLEDRGREPERDLGVMGHLTPILYPFNPATYLIHEVSQKLGGKLGSSRIHSTRLNSRS